MITTNTLAANLPHRLPFRIANCANAITVAVAIAAATVLAADYTWTGGGDDALWTTPANWGQTTKYPGSGDRSIFPAGCNAAVEVPAYVATTHLRVLAGATVRFYASDPAAESRIDLKSGWEFNYAGISVEFDHIRVDGSKDITLGSGASLTVRNGCDLRIGAFTASAAQSVSVLSGSVIGTKGVTADSSVGTTISVDDSEWTASGDFNLKNTATNLLSNGASMSVAQFIINGANTLLAIDNATFTVRSHVKVGSAAPGGGRVVFKGNHPLFKVNTGVEFYSAVNNASMTGPLNLDFEVPEGGFAEAPLQHNGSAVMRSNPNVPDGYLHVNVLASSPALSAGTRTDCPLFFSVVNGMTRSKLDVGGGTTATLRFTDIAGTTAATSDATAKAIYATVGSGPAATPAAAHGALATYTKTALARHDITAYGYATAIATGGDTTRVELWGGTANNAATMSFVATVAPASLGEFSAVFHEAEYAGDATYYFQWRLFDTDGAGATNHEAVSDIFSNTIVDSTTYTWTGRGGDSLWTNPSNWADDQNGDCYGYPQSSAASAVFPDRGEPYAVEVTQDLAVRQMTFNSQEVTLLGVGASRPKITASANPTFTKMTLDHLEISRTADHTFAAGQSLILKNGSLYTMNKCNLTAAGGTISIRLEGGSALSASYLYLGGDNELVLDDSTFTARSNECYLGNANPGGRIVFKGANPQFNVAASKMCGADLNGSNISFEFHVPAGGYASAPVTTVSNTGFLFGAPNGSKTGTLTIDVVSADGDGTGEYTCPLVVWAKGFHTSQTLLGTLPASAASASFALADTTADQVWADAAALTSSAKSLGVHIAAPVTVAPSWTDYTAPDGTWSAVADGNGNVVFTFTGSDNAGLRHWADAKGRFITASRTFTLPIADAAGVAPVIYHVWHVAMDGDDANGGTSPTDAKATMEAAHALLSSFGDTMLVHPGTYTNVANMVVSNGWRIVGAEGAASTFIATVTPFTSFTIGVEKKQAHGTGEVRGFTFGPEDDLSARFSHKIANVNYGLLADCVVRNIGSTSGGDYFCVVSTATADAIVSNCQFYACQGHNRTGAVIQQWTDGRIYDCQFFNCAGNNGEYGGCISLFSGLARNCLIVNCTGTGRAAGIDFYSTGGVAENCTIINCHSTSATVAGGIHSISGGGTLRNCIVYGCSNAGGEANISGNPVVEYSATAPLQGGEGNIALAAMPRFADAENGDYHVTAGATIDAGLNQSWMQTWGDLAGSPRILNGRVDMGAYEYSSEGAPLTVAIEPSATFALLGGEIALSAIVAPPDATGLSYAWTVTDHGSGATVFTTNGTGCATFTRIYPLGAYDVALTVTDDEERSATETAERVFSVKPHTVWVDGAASATYPYDTKATGFTTVAEAVDFAEDGMTIVLADGEHPNTASSLAVGKGVRIVGEHGADTTTYYTTASLTIDNAAAVFSGITIKSDYKHHEHNVHIASGTLDSCVITNWYRNYNTLFVSGGGLVTNCLLTGCATYANDNLIDVEGGSIVNSRIVGNKITGGTYGAMIRLTGGLVRGCLIAGNETRANSNTKGAIIYMNAPGTVESCTFADNRDLAADRCPAVWIPSTGGTVRNCIVMGNVNVDGAPIGFNADAAAAATHTLTDVPGLTGVGCKTETDSAKVFKSPASGDYRLTGVSPAVNKGANQPWMGTATDIDGTPRIIHRIVDMGCFEYPGEAATILFLR